MGLIGWGRLVILRHHQAENTLIVWAGVWSDDFMVIHDREWFYWDQVYASHIRYYCTVIVLLMMWMNWILALIVSVLLLLSSSLLSASPMLSSLLMYDVASSILFLFCSYSFYRTIILSHSGMDILLLLPLVVCWSFYYSIVTGKQMAEWSAKWEISYILSIQC